MRYGLKHKLIPWLFLNKGVAQSRSLALMHESEYNLSLLNNLLPKYQYNDLNDLSKSLITDMSVYQNSGIKIKSQIFPKLGKEHKLIVIHPGMTGHSLNWSARNYARLAQTILEGKPNASIVFSYTPSDKEYIETVKSQLSGIINTHSERLVFLDGSTLGLNDFISFIVSSVLYWWFYRATHWREF